MIKRSLLILLIMHSFCSAKIVKVGHRGAMGHKLENTFGSFKKAIELGVDMIELDVRLCKSGELIVCHDKRVDRITQTTGYIADKTLKELKGLTLKNGETFCTLREVFNCINRRVKIDIELKGEGTAYPVAQLIEEYVHQHGWSYDDFLVSTYFHYMLKEIKTLVPQVPLAAILEGILIDYAVFAQNLGVNVVVGHYNQINQAYIDDIHARGMKIFIHGANEIVEIEEMKTLGVDGIISNYPDRL